MGKVMLNIPIQNPDTTLDQIFDYIKQSEKPCFIGKDGLIHILEHLVLPECPRSLLS